MDLYSKSKYLQHRAINREDNQHLKIILGTGTGISRLDLRPMRADISKNGTLNFAFPRTLAKK